MKTYAWLAVATGLMTASIEAFAQESMLPGGGAPTPMEPTPAPPSATPEVRGFAHDESPRGGKYEGVHGFVGMGFVGGPTYGILSGGISGSANQLEGAYLFALRAGVYVDRHELAFEVSPLTYHYYTGADPTFQFTGTYGYLFPLAKNGDVEVSWPIRIGAGMMAGNTGGLALFQARADLIGLNLRVADIVIDLYFPQFRYAVTASDGTAIHFLTWFGGASLSYAL